MAGTALVTGASSGIGEETAKGLLAAGYIVYAGARRVDAMQSLQEAGARVVSLDVTDDASMTAAVDAMLRETGRIDVLVNNAGYGSYGALEDVPLDEGRAGRIVNVSSVSGKIGEPFGCWYHASKHALEGLSDSLRMELRPFGIDVVIIEPGSTRTAWGGIARDSLTRHSGEGPYRDGARAHVRMMASIGAGSLPKPPSQVAATIVMAVRSRRPRTRYPTGGGARIALFLRRTLSDRGFDTVIRLASDRARRSMTTIHD
jgi:NAD(P)-dependent dehydrogenase (short-subunit alcohol dehydrogenase family)